MRAILAVGIGFISEAINPEPWATSYEFAQFGLLLAMAWGGFLDIKEAFKGK